MTETTDNSGRRVIAEVHYPPKVFTVVEPVVRFDVYFWTNLTDPAGWQFLRSYDNAVAAQYRCTRLRKVYPQVKYVVV